MSVLTFFGTYNKCSFNYKLPMAFISNTLFLLILYISKNFHLLHNNNKNMKITWK